MSEKCFGDTIFCLYSTRSQICLKICTTDDTFYPWILNLDKENPFNRTLIIKKQTNKKTIIKHLCFMSLYYMIKINIFPKVNIGLSLWMQGQWPGLFQQDMGLLTYLCALKWDKALHKQTNGFNDIMAVWWLERQSNKRMDSSLIPRTAMCSVKDVLSD